MINKKILVDYFINIFNYYNINHNIIGHWIRALHYNIPIYIFIFIILLSKKYCLFFLFFFIFFIILPFILFKSCWVSSLENKLLKDNINICDIFLDLLNYDINNINRYYVTLIFGSIYFFILFFIYFIRFNL